ncbi:hypothetical protein M5K25_025157 [Dendrobium thyrsiflorum]|uniref:Uncharacterized protein n=1 Tax=Dendrobium thyrsiflorum TaxID=117978 RepID=A0ABD0U3L3_DENTH
MVLSSTEAIIFDLATFFLFKDIKNSSFLEGCHTASAIQEFASSIKILSFLKICIHCMFCTVESHSKMWPRRTLQQTPQDAEIEDLQQEIIRLKRRLSRLERRTNRSTLGRDFNGDRLRSKYATTKDSRYLVPFKSLLTDDDDEGISDDQISSTPTLIEFSFKEGEDPLPKLSSLPLYDEPVYDVYDDDMFFEALDVDKLMYEDDHSKMDAPPELCMHIVPVKAMNVLAIAGKGIDPSKLFYEDEDKPEGGDLKEEICYMFVVHLDGYRRLKDPGGPWRCEFCEDTSFQASLGNQQLGSGENTCSRVQCSSCSGVDIDWIYPDRFSQPNPPPSRGQPDLFLRARNSLLPR